jgi:hypothetical protein
VTSTLRAPSNLREAVREEITWAMSLLRLVYVGLSMSSWYGLAWNKLPHSVFHGPSRAHLTSQNKDRMLFQDYNLISGSNWIGKYFCITLNIIIAVLLETPKNSRIIFPFLI